MPKYFRTAASRDGKPVTLFVATTDEKISQDIASGAGYSLALVGRSENFRQHPTRETDHFDFAYGAFVAAAQGGLLLAGTKIETVDAIPSGLQCHHLGGRDRPYLIAVYEQPGA